MTEADRFEQLLARAAGLRRSGRIPEAIAAYEELLACRSQLPDSWFNLGWLRRRHGRHEAALEAYQMALDQGVAEPEEVHLNRAVIFSDDLARPDAAEAELQRAVVISPHYVPAWLNLGNLHEDRGDRQAAQAAYEQVLSRNPVHALALARLAQLRTLADPDDPLIARLRRALAIPRLTPAERADLGFGLGKALDDVASYDAAFDAYAAANRASAATGAATRPRYDRAAQSLAVDRLIAAFHPAMPAPIGAAAKSPTIFICGMFRSGSTLVEQMLGAHSRVTAAGELDLIPAIARGCGPALGDTAALAHAGEAPLDALRSQYREGVFRLHPGALCVTDKRPDNFLHIGLIKTLFPAAKVVYTRRHALDNCLAIFFLHLGPSIPYANDLKDIAHAYRQHERLMAHWKSIYGDDILEIDYDALVIEPRPMIERLLAFCDLPWEEGCLTFHRTPSVVKTASVWQVRQPLYRRSSGRWRHYERHLAGLRAALESAP